MPCRSVNFSAPRKHLNSHLARLEAEATMPEWLKRTQDAMVALRVMGHDESRVRWEREQLFELANALESLKRKRYESGAYVMDTLWQMFDTGYTEVLGTYVTSPTTGEKLNMRRQYVADGLRAIIRAKQG